MPNSLLVSLTEGFMDERGIATRDVLRRGSSSRNDRLVQVSARWRLSPLPNHGRFEHMSRRSVFRRPISKKGSVDESTPPGCRQAT
jgi:hypothetical protein